MRFPVPILSALTLMLVLAAPALAARGVGEVNMPSDEYARLDRFEAHFIGEADQAFNKQQWRNAAKTYDAFLLEYPRSRALPYAILRKARSLHHDGKRYEAIKVYNEVMDYFPNHLPYAAPALYYIGLAYWESGDEQDAMTAWAEMAEDVDYQKHNFAADAINRLARYLKGKGQIDKAVTYFRQIAVEFRTRNRDSANEAMEEVIYHYVRRKPDEDALRTFYRDTKTFDRHRTRDVPDDLDKDWAYWSRVKDYVGHHGRFDRDAEKAAERYYAYWTQTIGDRFQGNDDFRISMIHWQRIADGNAEAWMQRLDKQFANHQKAEDWDRILKWIGVYAQHENKVREYYAKLTFEKMSNGQIRNLMALLWDRVRDETMARAAFAKLNLSEMNDAQLGSLARYLWRKDGSLVEQVCRRFDDQEAGLMELLRYYQFAENLEKGVPLADSLTGSPAYAAEATWIKAEMLHAGRKWPEALEAYRAASMTDAYGERSLWKIADCYVRMGKIDNAVAQLREIENFVPKQASQAALRIAHVYRDAKRQSNYIAELRDVLKKYPRSSQSSAAHRELEALGVRIGGGVDAE